MVRSTSGLGGVWLLTGAISVVAWSSAASAAVDLTGKWRVEYSSTIGEFIDVTQTGAAVTTELHQPGGSPADIPLEGTFDEASGRLSLQVPGCSPPSCLSGMSVRMLPSGNDGNGLLVIGGPPLPGIGPILMNRCDCYDGNAINGDGCDATCRVEPCFTCSGTPSVCIPEPDGAACEDGSPCTTAQQCTAGVCGGGSGVTSCVDMTGTWDEHIVDAVFGISTDVVLRIRQRDTTVLFRNAVTGSATFLGIVDPATGAFDLRTPETIPLCPSVDGSTFTGTASLDNQHFSGTGTGQVATPRFCFGDTFLVTGTRRLCDLDGTTDPGEVCDDGNLFNGDGCDSNCTPTACGNGIVSAGEACDDGNVVDNDGCDSNCTRPACGNGIVNPGEACDDGNITSGDGCDAACVVEPCYRCTAGVPSTCATTYQPACSAPTRLGQARLEVSQLADDARDALKLRVKRTSALDAALLGDPTVDTAYDVCLYDASSATPQLLYGARVLPGNTCNGKPCWKGVKNGFVYENPAGEVRKLKVVGGAEPHASVDARGPLLSSHPHGLPSLPLPLPLTMQVHEDDVGTGCFSADFPASGVKKNDPARGTFRAKGP